MYERAGTIGLALALLAGVFVIYGITADSTGARVIGSTICTFVIGWSIRGLIDSHWIRQQVAELRDIINQPRR